MMNEKKKSSDDVTDLWAQELQPIPANKYIKSVANTEKILVYSETGAGKTTFYLNIIRDLKRRGVDPKDFTMTIIFPDRPTGLSKIFDIVPRSYREYMYVFPVNNYEDVVKSTAKSQKMLIEHFEKTGTHGWMVFELLENYWTFAQDYYSRQAYGESMGHYFAQMMRTLTVKDKQSAYEAFAGPYGGPWPIIKFFHNYNWIDRIKRMHFNVLFTSEVKEEANKDSIFFNLGLRPAGEKNNMHRVDTIIYLSHKGNEYFMKPFKLTGYTRTYSETKITNKNGYEVHKLSLKQLTDRGFKTSKIENIEKEAGIIPPVKQKQPKVETIGDGDGEENQEQETIWNI